MNENNNVEVLNEQPIQQPVQQPVQPVAPAPAPVPTPTPAPVAPKSIEIPEEYKPISMWGYFGYELLFSIPCVGFIVLLVMAFGSKNVNVKNFARSYFCYMIIAAIIFALFFFVFGGAAIFATYSK